MRILQIVHSLPFLNYAGTEVYTYDLSLELAKRHQVFIFARECDTKQKEYEVREQNINGITVYLINNTFKCCDSFQMYYENELIDERFGELLDQVKPDIVHIQHLVFLSIGLVDKIKERGIPIIFTLHDFWLMCPRWHVLKENLSPCEKVFQGSFDEECLSCVAEVLNIKKSTKKAYLLSKKILPAFLLKGLKKIYFSCAQKISNGESGINMLKDRNRRIKSFLSGIDYFVSPSRYLRNKFIEFGLPAKKIKYSKYGLNNNLFMDIKKTKSSKTRFAFIGTILPAKGVHMLIEAFNRVNATNAELKIYGRFQPYAGFEHYPLFLKKIIKNKNIRFMGEFNHNQIAKIFKEIDVLVVPSIWYENSPLVIQEAALSKTPVIATRIGGIPELVADGVNGLLSNPVDALDLREKIEYLIDSSHILERFKENIPAIKSIEESAKEMEEAYTNLAANKSAGLK